MRSVAAQMPPFAALITFEAVLRLGSMTLAAEELGLTQSAVSHRISALERFFGVSLLERLNPGLRATDAGARLGRELVPLMGTMAGLRRQITMPAGPRHFRLGLSPALLAWWLSPRLPALCKAFSDLSIEICTWDSAAEAARAEVDLALLWVPSSGTAEEACELSFPTEKVFPVASPRLLATIGSDAGWQTLPLLAKGRRDEESGREWSWTTWLGKSPGHESLRFRNIGSSLQAALDGSGVALGRSLLVADALGQNRLVRLAGPGEALGCSRKQVARWRDPRDGTAERMAAWLVASAQEAMAPDQRAAADAA